MHVAFELRSIQDPMKRDYIKQEIGKLFYSAKWQNSTDLNTQHQNTCMSTASESQEYSPSTLSQTYYPPFGNQSWCRRDDGAMYMKKSEIPINNQVQQNVHHNWELMSQHSASNVGHIPVQASAQSTVSNWPTARAFTSANVISEQCVEAIGQQSDNENIFSPTYFSL